MAVTGIYAVTAIFLCYCENILEGYKKGELKSYLLKELPVWLPEEVKANAARGNDLAIENIAVIKAFYEEN